MTAIKRIRVGLIWLLSIGLLGIERVSAQSSELIRDTWGVPHVVSESESAAMYGLGYAQAEDRLEDIYMAIRTGLGRISEVQGPSGLEQDYLMRLTHNDTLHEAYYANAPEQVRRNLEAFTAGIRAYISEHPQEASGVSIAIEPWHPLAVGRAMILRWPIGTVMDDVKNASERSKPAAGSNQWAVSPKRSADRLRSPSR